MSKVFREHYIATFQEHLPKRSVEHLSSQVSSYVEATANHIYSFDGSFREPEERSYDETSYQQPKPEKVN